MIAKSNLDGIWNKVRFLGQAFSWPKLTFWRFYYFEEAFIHKEKVKWEKPLISSKKLKRKYGSSRRKLKSAPQKITPQFRSRQLSLYLSEAFSPIKWFLFSWHFLKIEFSRSIWRFYVLFKFPRHRFDFLKDRGQGSFQGQVIFCFFEPFFSLSIGPLFFTFLR